jgi:hypothetical protein
MINWLKKIKAFFDALIAGQRLDDEKKSRTLDMLFVAREYKKQEDEYPE